MHRNQAPKPTNRMAGDRPTGAALGAPIFRSTSQSVLHRIAVLLAAVAAACGSAALFLGELYAGKSLLPRFGGAPDTWVVCLAFFQGALVVAYGCTDMLVRRSSVRTQLIVQTTLLALAAVMLATGSPASRSADAMTGFSIVGRPGLAVVGDLVMGIGVPFFALATLGPLLAHWRSHLGAADELAAYRLSVAANAGSALVLILYPFAIETIAGLGQQREVLLRLVLVTMFVAATCGAYLAGTAAGDCRRPEGPRVMPQAKTMLRWMLLAAIPASWLASVTAHATVEVAPIPLLWILPLAIYLGSLAFVFGPGGRSLARYEPWILGGSVVTTVSLLGGNVVDPPAVVLTLYLLAFFGACVALHGRLFDERPPVEDLTTFYLALAAGGACGGIFNAAIAPVVFNSRHEFPLAVIAAACLVPRLAFQRPSARATSLLACVGLVLGGLLVAGYLAADRVHGVIHRERSFFGVLEVCNDQNGRARTLRHGNIIHGVQLLDDRPDTRRIALAYYHANGPLGSVVASMRVTGGCRRVGVAGLGIGSIAAFAEKGDDYTFFEIDPAVARIARDPRWFTLLHTAPAAVRVVLDDARLALNREPTDVFDLLVIDAFTGDSVPTHLLTREALASYGRTVAPDGCIAFHVTNRYLDLVPIVAALAADAGWVGLVGRDGQGSRDRARFPSCWMVLGRDERRIEHIYAHPTADDWQWAVVLGNPRDVWTDDRSPLAEALAWRRVRPRAVPRSSVHLRSDRP